MDYHWTDEEIRLTRFAWALKDADDWMDRRQRERRRAWARGLVVAGVVWAVVVGMSL